MLKQKHTIHSKSTVGRGVLSPTQIQYETRIIYAQINYVSNHQNFIVCKLNRRGEDTPTYGYLYIQRQPMGIKIPLVTTVPVVIHIRYYCGVGVF